MTERWGSSRDADEVALERYRYLLRTAPPEDLERAHAEAFAQLTPEQRRMLLEGLVPEAGPGDARAADDSPEALARLATRTELRHPGTIERLFGPQRGGWAGGGFGNTFAGSMLGTIAGVVVGSAIAGALFDTYGDPAAGDPGATVEGDGGADTGAAGGDGGYEEAASDGGGYEDGGGFDGGGGFDIGGGDFDLGGF